ncbi:MAG: hypothetical protein GEU88_05690 [Solirubrobacterales bacterium]|nr:hypothetical protein [Solirubrobacterales bacterium]
MGRDVRTALLTLGLVFCGLFAAMTAAVAVEYGFDIFTVAAIAILALIVPPLIGALLHRDD